MSTRKLRQVTWHSQSLTVLPASDEQMTIWLNGQAAEHKLQYALVHADDGVIWGTYDSGSWKWSGDHFEDVSPKLRALTVQQARMFGPSAEVLVWRDGDAFRGRAITDAVGGSQECFDETQVLWGKPDGDAKDGFMLMREGAQGLLHAPPVAIAQAGKLVTRNYIDYDADGCAFVKASRLVANEGAK
jgi:CRISPR-associated protein (TIGR03984 family)